MWVPLQRGTKTWDARVFDVSDPRIQRLAAGHWEQTQPLGRKPVYVFNETFVCFLNKETNQVLEFRFRGLILTGWSPGWCFIHLGGLVCTMDSDGNPIP